ncbi:MAG: ABC transporter ATP-binding protein, partial [Polyangiaceae bacterium]|nr:ABC transporter ATP-binding protein [Polyangiaceae bacterium]
LYGFIEPDGGSILYEGRDFRAHRTEIKRTIGVCTQDDTLDYDFSVKQNLEVYAGYFRPKVGHLRERVEALLVRFGLEAYRNHTPQALSGGYKRRLLIARSVVHSPRVLFLDEPTTGLDPRARLDVWRLVDSMRAEGMGIILTTHYMDEAERLSDELLVLSRGEAIARGSPAEVLGRVLGEHVVVIPPREPGREAIARWIAQNVAAHAAEVLGELRVPMNGAELARFGQVFGGARFSVRTPNLDDLFLELSERGRLPLPVDRRHDVEAP